MVGAMLNKRDKPEDVVHKDPATEILENKFSRHPIHLLSSGQICLGVISVICQIVVSCSNDVHLNLSTVNEGIFCGIVFFTAGSVGLFTSYRINQSNVTAFLVTSIFSSIFSVILLLLSCCLLSDTLWYQEEDGYGNSNFLLLKTFLSLEIILSIIELSLSITCASLCSKSCCFNDQASISAHSYPVVPVKMFSGLQILVGVCSILFFFILFTLSFDARHTLTFEEIYCGLVFIGIGIFGFYTVRRLSVTSLTPFMVLNIFGCIFAGLLLVLALVRIYMLDKVQDKYLTLRQEDLLSFPKLNCTRDVLETIYPKRFTTPSPEVIRINIDHCEKMKRDAIAEAKEILSSGSEFEGPRKIYQLEIALALFEALAAVICASFCCRACCCCGEQEQGYAAAVERREGSAHRDHVGTPAPGQGEKDQATEHQEEGGRREYNEYRK
eukprot:TRINITY_DN10614_c0_g1_i1.p1 TRINITY_DN10614_c0_g1~~TRINITY_DN10614_c0_g1_i1.p1  ORF type:complete len:440 (-),score=114.94 TRINITY_DN10614_c0_g1_i1:149-1468(-)